MIETFPGKIFVRIQLYYVVVARENTIKRFVAHGVYHIYNRGNNKEVIYFEEKDYWVFRRFVKKSIEKSEGNIIIKAFALLPNHYHLLIQQKSERSISTFMRRLSGFYGRYISVKYKRVGNLYGGIYRAILIEENDISRVKKYILSNPLEAGYPEWKHAGQSP